jgi:ribose transport system substrate-binding protein
MRIASALGLSLCLATALGCGGGRDAASKPRVSFITNCVDPFWDLAIAGAKAAGEEYGVEVLDYCPPSAAIDEQVRRVEDDLTRGVDGIAISPLDADNMVAMIDAAAEQTHVITHDSDAPASQRRCFIGCDNYAAGRAVGKLVKKAIPDGGEVMLFIGRLEQDNSKKRRQGVIDELLGRAPDSTRRDPNDGPISGNGYTILGTLTDNGDTMAAQSKAEDALTNHADLDVMVGLFAYNPPACLAAIESQGRAGEVQVVGFDEHRATIQAILGGKVVGTVSQNPYQYGYESVRILKGLIDGDESVLPAGGVLRVEFAVYERDNAQELMDLLDEIQAEGK